VFLRRLNIFFLALAGLLMSSASFAVSPLDRSDLQAACEAYADYPASPTGFHCVLYIQGFLDGAVATDERVTMNIADELDRSETLTERAIRTRLGDRVRTSGPTIYAEYCVGDPVPVQEIITHVLEQLTETDADTPILARDVVYAALRRHYPCEG